MIYQFRELFGDNQICVKLQSKIYPFLIQGICIYFNLRNCMHT